MQDVAQRHDWWGLLYLKASCSVLIWKMCKQTRCRCQTPQNAASLKAAVNGGVQLLRFPLQNGFHKSTLFTDMH
ncbi:unnamed protein product, partial [Dicrocoelium dendriticum]